jgi:hypothetical protein
VVHHIKLAGLSKRVKRLERLTIEHPRPRRAALFVAVIEVTVIEMLVCPSQANWGYGATTPIAGPPINGRKLACP